MFEQWCPRPTWSRFHYLCENPAGSAPEAPGSSQELYCVRVLIIAVLSFLSMRIEDLFKFFAAFPVVPEPHIGSSTVSPSSVDIKMIRSMSLTGFAVGYVRNSEPWLIE